MKNPMDYTEWGSAFWEVGLLGKPIISLVKSWYDPFNLAYKLYSRTSFGFEPFIEEFNMKNRVIFLRALYLFQFSFTQFTGSVFHKTGFGFVSKLPVIPRWENFLILY